MNRQELLKIDIDDYIKKYGMSKIKDMYKDYCSYDYLPAQYSEFKKLILNQDVDTVELFMTDSPDIRGHISKEIYNTYLDFCKQNRFKYLGYIAFRKQLMSKYGLKSKQIRVNNTRIYILY